MLVDLHAHVPAEGPQVLRAGERAKVLDAIVVVYPLDALPAAVPHKGDDGERPVLLVGVEVDEPRGAFVALPPAPAALESAPAIAADADARDVDRAVAFAEQGWAVVALHPFGTRCGTPGGETVAQREGIHAVEVRTEGIARRDHDSAIEVAAGARLAAVAGTGSDDVDAVGRHAALVAADEPTQAAVVAALRAGDAWVAGITWPAGPDEGASRAKKRRRRRRRKKPDVAASGDASGA